MIGGSIMPIDKNMIIQPKTKEEKKKNKLCFRDICLLITTITTCFSAVGYISAYKEAKTHKLQYELEIENYKNDIQKLQLEKDKYDNDVERLEMEKETYKNMLNENDIQLRSSYIVCNTNYIESLYNNLGDDNNIKILSNEITDMFYNKTNKKYLNQNEIQKRDVQLQNKYNHLYAEVIFLKIEVISSRIVNNITINFRKIETNNNIEDSFETFNGMYDKDDYEDGNDIVVNVGDMNPNDIILIPVVLEFSEPTLDYEASNFEVEYIVYDDNSSIYREIYIPKTITCYDNFIGENKKFEIRDVLEDSLITNYYFEEKG